MRSAWPNGSGVFRNTPVGDIPPTKPADVAGKAHQTIAPRSRTLDLQAAWQLDRVPRVSGEQLPDAVDALFEHHHALGVLGPPTAGMTVHRGLGPDGALELIHTPNRSAARDAQSKIAPPCGCVLCNPPNPDQRGLAWREYTVWPNVFPYLPIEDQPVVISASKHRDQQFSSSIMRDMIDYQAFAGAKSPVTMFYHHFAGNSEPHLHWHATTYEMPLSRALDLSALVPQPLRQDARGTVETFEDAFFGGLLVSGDRDYVAGWAARLVREVEQDPASGAYNLMLLEPRDGQVRLAVFVRREAPRPGDEDRAILGAPEIAGSFVMPLVNIPAGTPQAKLQATEQNRVRPSELSWLQSVRNAPASDLIALRAKHG